jgi:hypothetical protein
MTVPTLDAIAADVDALRDVPREVLGVLLERAAIVQARLQWAVYTAAMRGPVAEDDLLDVVAAARVLGLSPLTLSHKHKHPPYAAFVVPTGSRVLRFSRRAIEEWRASQAGSLAASPVAPPSERKPMPLGPGSPTWLRKGDRGRRSR